MSIPAAALEAIIDTSGVAPRIEALLPAGSRHRQLKARTLLVGMLLVLAGRRPAFLTEVHLALITLPGPDQARLGVTEDWTAGPHLLTYRQVERTFGLVAQALGKSHPDGAPSEILTRTCDGLLEASIPGQYKDASTALAVDWTDAETFARPPRHGTTGCADPEASWGHRTTNLPGPKGEMFFGYYHSARHHGPRRTRPRHPRARPPDDPPLLPPRPGPRPGRRPAAHAPGRHPPRRHHRRLRLRPPRRSRLGHPAPRRRRPADPGPAPARPRPARHPPRRDHRQRKPVLPGHPQAATATRPATPGATTAQTAAHDTQAAELARHKLGRITADDADGYHRVACPAVMGKLRCPARPQSMRLDRDRPEILAPPENPPACCRQQTITVPPQVAAKTRQKHDYPSPAHRRSYARRTAAERTFATVKDTASNNISRGWCRLRGLTPLTLWLACVLITRNQRILAAWDARQAGNTRRAAAGLPPRTRKRRRTTLATLTAAPP